jgi:mannose/fructose/N-acetylgalactosamine-specific phosphotransferase system component IID
MKLRKIGKRGVLENLEALAVGAVTLLIAVVVVFLIAANIAANTQVAADSNASAAVSTIQQALQSNVVGFIGLVLLVAVASLLIFLVKRFRA